MTTSDELIAKLQEIQLEIHEAAAKRDAVLLRRLQRRQGILQKQLEELRLRARSTNGLISGADTGMWDVFICHASEDKEAVARPLADALSQKGLKVWYDEFTLTLGDSLRRSIDAGLAQARYGVVILSPDFFAKEWPQRELDGLVAQEASSGKKILPVWHNVTEKDVVRFSPTLADKYAVSTEKGMDAVVQEILRVVPPGVEYDGLTLKFLRQFHDNNVLPLGVTFRFIDYHFLTPGFLTLVITSEEMTPENGDRFKSVLKAYLLCVLGTLAPRGMLVSDTLNPAQSTNSVRVGSRVAIAVPRWFVAGLEELGRLHVIGQYERDSNRIVLTLQPMLVHAARNYDLLGIKLENIGLLLKGKDLSL